LLPHVCTPLTNREEVGDRGGDIVHLQNKAEEPSLEIGNSQPEGFSDAKLIRGILGCTINFKTILKLRLLPLVEPLDIPRGVGHPNHEDETETDGHCSLYIIRAFSLPFTQSETRTNDEEPSPSAQTVRSAQIEDSEGEQTAEGIPDLRPRIKDSGTKSHLLLLVEEREEKDGSGEL
jgi:hypothetical protein